MQDHITFNLIRSIFSIIEVALEHSVSELTFLLSCGISFFLVFESRFFSIKI